MSEDWDEIPQSEGLAEIDVDGTEGSPITWRLPEGTIPSDPVGVTQRLITLDLHAGTPGAEPRVGLATSVAHDGALAILRGHLMDPTADGDYRSAGPLWIWLDDAEVSGDRATARDCLDAASFQPSGSLTSAGDGRAWFAELVRVEDFDGPEVWRVSRYNSGPLRESNPFEAQCPAWADHTP